MNFVSVCQKNSPFSVKNLDLRQEWLHLGIPDDADQCSGDADQRFQDDGDHDSGMMPITRSGMIPIS